MSFGMPVLAARRRGDGGSPSLLQSSSLIALAASQSGSSTDTTLSLGDEIFGSGWKDGNSAVVPSDVSLIRPSFQFHNNAPSSRTWGKVNIGGSDYLGMPSVTGDSAGDVAVNAAGALKVVSSGNIATLVGRDTLASGQYFSDSARRSWLSIEAVDPATRYCLAHKSATQALPNLSFTAIAWDAEAVDSLGCHDTVTNNSRFTIPASTTGLFRITANCGIDADTATTQLLSSWPNGDSNMRGAAGYPERDQDDSIARLNICSAILELDEGDYVETPFYVSGSSSNISSQNHNWAQIEEMQACERVLLTRQSSFSLSAETSTAIPFEYPAYDVGGWFDGSKAIVPEGVSHIEITIFAKTTDQNTSDFQIAAEINGSRPDGAPLFDTDTTGPEVNTAVSGIIPVSEGDEVALVAYSTFARTIDQTVWMGIRAVAVSSEAGYGTFPTPSPVTTGTFRIPSGKVLGDVTNLPVKIDMCKFPRGMWQASNNGEDIRFFNSLDDAEIPTDLVYANPSQENGCIWVLVPTVYSVSATDIYWTVDGVSSRPSDGSTYGKNAVWSDYEYVGIPYENYDDRTGNNGSATVTGSPVCGLPYGLVAHRSGGGSARMSGSDYFSISFTSFFAATGGNFALGVSGLTRDNTQDGFAQIHNGSTRLGIVNDDGNNLGVWDNTNTWSYVGLDPDNQKWGHYFTRYNGAAERNIHATPNLETTDLTISSRASAGYNTIKIGASYNGTEPFYGQLGMVWLRPEYPSDNFASAWMAMMDDWLFIQSV